MQNALGTEREDSAWKSGLKCRAMQAPGWERLKRLQLPTVVQQPSSKADQKFMHTIKDALLAQTDAAAFFRPLIQSL